MMRIATRRSALARAQAHQTGELLSARGAPFELVPLATTGDLEPDRAIGSFDAKGLFVDTIRQAVLDGNCDLAVHSYKDLPTDPVPGLRLAAVPVREDPRDLLVTRDGYALANLPRLASVGTSSERRRIQLLRARSDLHVLPIRGNLDTRLRKVADGEFDAVVVAMAGLRRLYTAPERGGVGKLTLPLKAVALEPGECLPAAGQGALAIECRTDDRETLDALAAIDDPATRKAVTAERAFLSRVGGGCLAPVGALATVSGGRLELVGMLADPGRRRLLRQSHGGPSDSPEAVGVTLAETMLRLGGDELLAAVQQARTEHHAGGIH